MVQIKMTYFLLGKKKDKGQRVKSSNIIWVHELCLPTKKIVAGLEKENMDLA
jgi:hypothetical protein